MEIMNIDSKGSPESDFYLKKFRNFKFTGDLRPWPITDIKRVPKHIPKPDYADDGVPYSEIDQKFSSAIKVHDPQTIKKIRRACLLGRKALDLANTLIKPGITTDEIDTKVHEFIVSHNGYPSPLNYYNFPKSICTSVNEVVCHGIPDLRPLEEGDIVNVDISVYLNGVHGDLNETFYVGEVDDDSMRLTEGTYASLMEAIKQCKPGMYYREIGNIINDVADKFGYFFNLILPRLSVIRSYCGHGIGTEFHCCPNIPHYRKNKAIGILRPNQVWSLNMSLGTFRDVKWPDKWTVVTTDGKRSAQFEHTLLVTNTGVEVLTKRLESSPPLGFDTTKF
ncbi:methionine aminopeptidase 1, putative [Theileria annulata]|uniref:Methionine aminopeptidase n=1 Tax=Theileria annulata TaxID=5874 RepID=Q4UAM2_THEAN|nr:methionine aminopeptidase 1, putative [Theileria annulata]CAI76129.1 methionine aminopeptidase 1, putative [Theileria annulata]|eukprot:XP_952755.1 methionine aminopeptidase 1, putative [Theileria annulata]